MAQEKDSRQPLEEEDLEQVSGGLSPNIVQNPNGDEVGNPSNKSSIFQVGEERRCYD